MTLLKSGIISLHPVQILSIGIQLVKPLSSKDRLQRIEILFIHARNPFEAEVYLSVFATGGAINRIDILGRPDELL